MTDDSNELEIRLEKAFMEQSPSCLSCGWSNAFFELEFEPTGKCGEYWAACMSKDADDSETHRGYYLYLNGE
jgi:hypothetical protein